MNKRAGHMNFEICLYLTVDTRAVYSHPHQLNQTVCNYFTRPAIIVLRA